MGITKITRNYQITIPKDVRELKGLKEGDSIIFSIQGNNVDILKVSKDVINSAAGLWKAGNETGMDYEKRIRSGWKRRLARERR